MTAKGAAIEREHREPLGSCIDCGGKTRGTSADDDHIINLVRVDGFDEANAAGKFDIAGIAQQSSIGAEHDRQVAGVDSKALDQGMRARISERVEPLMRMPVAGEEPFEAQNIAVIGAADDYWATGAGIEEADPVQDQGAHDALAEFCFFDHQIAQPMRRNDDRLDRLRGNGVDQGRAVG